VKAITNFYYKYDLPDSVKLEGDLAIDTEAMGLNNLRDRLCVIQISDGKGDAHVVHFPRPEFKCVNLRKLLLDPKRTKIFHFARFDVAILQHYFAIELSNIFCTKIASRITRTYTDQHGLKDICQELLDIRISKQQQTSDWGAEELSKDQIAYAASDVLHLHALRDKLNQMLRREGREELARKCFEFIPTRAKLDTSGWLDVDIFQH
jgi:ribonuclease D